MKVALAIVFGLGVLMPALPASAEGDLASARALYASASYEAALATLATLEGAVEVEPLNELRALCLLALGRTRDAEQAITRMVMHNPVYALNTAGVSPKLVTLFTEVRRRVLPAAVRAMYAQAKASYDQRQWREATREFAVVMAALEDPQIARDTSFGDLRQLAEGFQRLSEVEYAAVGGVVEPLDVRTALRRAALGSSADAETGVVPDEIIPTIYSTLDRRVSAPVEQRSFMPRWSPATGGMPAHSPGVLEIIIDDTGRVARATMLRPTTPGYDATLVSAARTWRYLPAVKDGKPVHYRMAIEIVLRPGQ